MALSPEQARKILDANEINLARKVSDGKPLSQPEIAMLQAVAGGKASADPSWASNQVELADILKVNRKTIQRWAKEPGNPGAESNGKWNVALWKEWAKQKGHDFDDEGLNQSAAKARQILLQNTRLEHKIAIEKGEWIPRSVARQVFTQLVFAAKSRCFSGIPRFVMLARMAADTTAAGEDLRKEMEDIWSQLTTGEWYQDHDSKHQ